MRLAIAALVLLLMQMPVVLGEERVTVVYSAIFTCSTSIVHWSDSIGRIDGKLTVQIHSLDDAPVRSSYAALANAQEASLHWYDAFFCGASKAQLTIGGQKLVNKTVEMGFDAPQADCQCSSPSCITYAYVHCGNGRGTDRFEVVITQKSMVTTISTPIPTTVPLPPTTTPPPVGVPATLTPTPISGAPFRLPWTHLMTGIAIFVVASSSINI